VVKKIRITDHADFEMKRRRINKDIVLRVVRNPKQRIRLKRKRQICQSKYLDETEKKQMLLRVVIEEVNETIKIITAYKTSKIEKYWISIQST
jgi:hypothetical protein